MFLKIGLFFLVMKLIEISAIELNCVYSKTADGYNCKAENLVIESSNQKISKVNGEHVKGFSEVEVFYVHSNLKVKYLPIGLNEHFPQLRKLNVQLSTLKYISKDDFYNSNSLKIINFAGNQIETIPADVFSTLDQLEYLSLSKNKITKIYSSTFENLPKLQELYLQDNQIEELDENLFKNNLELNIISLSRNRLKLIGPKLVTQLMKLTKIEFSGDDNCIKKNYVLSPDIRMSLSLIEIDFKTLCYNLKNDKLDLTTKLQNQKQIFNQETSQLKEENFKVVDGLKKSSGDLQKQFNELLQTNINLNNKNNNPFQMFDIKLNRTIAQKLNYPLKTNESILLMNDNKILRTTLQHLQNFRKNENQTYQLIIQSLKNNSINNMTLLNTEIESLKIKLESQTNIFALSILLLCSGCLNIVLIILLILLLRSSKKSKIQKIETTLIMAENNISNRHT